MTTRYAGYVRISSEEQVGNFSVDAQTRAIQEWVKSHEGTLVKLYIDEAQSGRTADRPEFQAMRRDAKKHLFDAIVVHKFDRFSRNRTDALAIKSLLRQDYGIKVFSVTEPSEDSDGAIGALIEGIMESVADWYSRNLATETKKGKRERATQGLHNNQPPFGMDKAKKGVLYPNDAELIGLKLAFELYDTGNYSDNQVATELNQRGFVSKTGQPFTTDTVRDMLQNRTYLGFVKYQSHERNADGSRSYRSQIEWYPGQHQAVIDEDLFEHCQRIRRNRARVNQYYPKHRVYLLRDLIYCAECIENIPDGADPETYGRMRPQAQRGKEGEYRYYRCRARDFGQPVSHDVALAETVEEQVVEILNTLKPPPDWRKKMITALGELLEEQNLQDRVSQIKEVIERMDFRWDHGFITDKDNYLEERIRLQQELEALTPIPDDDLEEAASILTHFRQHWEATADDRQAQARLIRMIVARVWVRKGHVIALSLRPNYHITVGLENTKPTELTVGSDENFIQDRERRAWYAHWVCGVGSPKRHISLDAKPDHYRSSSLISIYTTKITTILHLDSQIQYPLNHPQFFGRKVTAVSQQTCSHRFSLTPIESLGALPAVTSKRSHSASPTHKFTTRVA